VASADEGDFPAIFPRDDIGGNIDCRYISVGSTLYLPVNAQGALFAVGDGHFAQGNGEICGTAIETMMKSRIRLIVIKGKLALKPSHYETAVQRIIEMHSVRGKGGAWAVTSAEDQSSAARKALEGLMDWLVTEKGLTRVEAYILISVAGNLKIMHELGLPVHTVTASIPLGIFTAD
jgi:acetamidase/formamidase